MLTFKVNEIRQGVTKDRVELEPSLLESTPYPLKSGVCDITFHRTNDRIKLDLTIKAEVELQCDRSLESFVQEVSSVYTVVLDPSIKVEEEDEFSAVRALNVSKNQFDLTDIVRDSVVLSIPLKKIHPKFNPDEAFIAAFETADPEDSTIDPRWDALKNLLNNKN